MFFTVGIKVLPSPVCTAIHLSKHPYLGPLLAKPVVIVHVILVIGALIHSELGILFGTFKFPVLVWTYSMNIIHL